MQALRSGSASTLLLSALLAQVQQPGETPRSTIPAQPPPIAGTAMPKPPAPWQVTVPQDVVIGQSARPRPPLVLLPPEPALLVPSQASRYLQEKGPEGKVPGTERWIVTFQHRSFDLSAYRAASYADAPAADVAPLIADMERRVVQDQAGFVEAITALGGRVTRQWWIINGAAIEVPRTALVLIAGMPDVATLEPDRSYGPDVLPGMPVPEPMILVSTNASNHNADAVQALGYDGAGIGVAIMDTGQDSNMAGTGSPHRTYYRDGVKPGTNLLLLNRQMGAQAADDTHGHGTGVCGIAAGATWTNAGADFGHAFNAYKLGYSICDTAGSCTTLDATRVSAWQQIATDRASYNIKTANNSYGGSPDATNAVQQALDSVALNSNIFIACSAGNTGSSTTGSQSVANGLAVAACAPTTKTIASFSSRGPLSGDTARYYPDITACGVGTVMPRRDSETTNYVADGTSMASPQVCGAATLMRQARSDLTALETKAILLASTESIASQNPGLTRNDFGMGFLRDDLAVALARNDASVFRDTVTQGASKYTDIYVTQGNVYAVAITWHRVNFATTAWNDVDLYVRQGGSSGTVIASSLTTRNLYERVVFTAPITGNLTIQVYGYSVTSPATETYALAQTALTGLAHPRANPHVVPATAVGAMSPSDNNIPFSWTPTRYQQVFLGSEVSDVPFNIKRLGLRQDQEFGSLPGQTVDLEFKLGYTTYTPATITGTYASNYNSGSASTVLTRSNVVLPDMPMGNNNPDEFFLDIPLTTPFPFLPAAGRNLLLEVVQRGNSNGNASFTYPLDAVNSGNTTRIYGADTATTGTVHRNYGLAMCLDGPDACTIVPLAARTIMGNNDNAIPFSWTPVHYQQVFLASELGESATYQGMGLRQDNVFGAGYPGAAVDVEIVLGHTTYDPATLTSTFANNITGSSTVVVPRTNLVLPTMATPANTDPRFFLLKIPFIRPFYWNGSNNLIVDVMQRGNSRGNASFAYPLDAHSGTGVGTTRLFGGIAAATGTLSVNYGLVMCFDTNSSAVPGTYDYFGSGCAGGGAGVTQTVLPAAMATAMGNSNNRFPFGAAPQRYQQLMLGSEVPTARTFTGVGMRQNASFTNYPGFAVDLEIRLGYSTLTPATLSTTFASNYNVTTPVTVLSRQLVVLPNYPATGNSDPAAFFCKIPFTTPFAYAPVAGRNLLLEVVNRGNYNGNDDFDYPLDALSGGTSSRLYAINAPDATTGTVQANYGVVLAFLSAGSTGAVPLLTAVGDPVIGNSLQINLWQARANSVGILFLGFSNSNWLGIPLPLPLAGAGAPGCSLLVAGDVILSANTNSAGFASFLLPVPADRSLLGGQFFNQYAVFDPGINALSLSWTRGGHGTIGNQ